MIIPPHKKGVGAFCSLLARCSRPTTAHSSKQAEKNNHAGGILNPKSVHEGFRPLHTSGMYIHTRGAYLKFVSDYYSESGSFEQPKTKRQ